jgi:hypothetical protein
MVGRGCYRKFGLGGGRGSIHPALKSVLSNILEKGEYTKINDVLLYCKYVECKLTEYYMSQITPAAQITSLEILREEVLYLIDREGLKYMGKVLSEIDGRIAVLEVEREEKERLEREALEKDRLEREQRRKALIDEEEKRVERERERKALLEKRKTRARKAEESISGRRKALARNAPKKGGGAA